MSTPPFIAMPEGVALLGLDTAPVPMLLAEPTTPLGNVLLVPGFTGSKEDFIAVLEPLARRGWRTAALDLPGQNGFAPLGPRGSHTERALAGSVHRAVQWLGTPVHVVGHSLGGLVTRHLVLAHPGDLASWTALCSGPGAIPADQRDPLLSLRRALGVVPMSDIWALKESLDREDGWSPPDADVHAFVTSRFMANDPHALADLATILLTAPDLGPQLRAALAASGLVAAVVTGELDTAWPIAEQERMATELGAPWHLLPGVGHSPAASHPEATAAILDHVFDSAG